LIGTYGDDADPPEGIAPEKTPLLKYAPVTSCDVERYFSAYKHILSDKRQSLTPENYNCVFFSMNQ
jgi:hypothetical protein